MLLHCIVSPYDEDSVLLLLILPFPIIISEAFFNKYLWYSNGNSFNHTELAICDFYLNMAGHMVGQMSNMDISYGSIEYIFSVFQVALLEKKIPQTLSY